MSVVNNQRGSILLVVFTVSIVVAVLMTSMYFLMLQSATRQSRRGEAEAYAAMLYSLRAQIEDPTECHKLLGGLPVPANAVKAKINNIQFNWKYGNDPAKPKSDVNGAVFKAGWKLPKTQLTVKDIVMVRTAKDDPSTDTERNMRVHIKSGGSLKTYKVVPLRLYVYLNEFGLNMADVDPSSGAFKEAPEDLYPMVRRDLMIRFLANVDSSGKIFNCFGFESSAAACQAMGAAYNHTSTVSSFKCQPDKQCFAGKQGLVSNRDTCKTGMPVPYEALDMGFMDGKKVYMCRLCREDL